DTAGTELSDSVPEGLREAVSVEELLGSGLVGESLGFGMKTVNAESTRAPRSKPTPNNGHTLLCSEALAASPVWRFNFAPSTSQKFNSFPNDSLHWGHTFINPLLAPKTLL
ncbi:MAG TPA: hypothetical protein VG778_04445, partial [Blastocatellia bacterium]|nr:hypothetical protein [Blastocatellia bacterium]